MMIVSDDAEALALDGKENFEFKPKEEKNNNAEGTGGTLCAYELERLTRIQRNQQIMQNMGIDVLGSTINGMNKKSKKRPLSSSFRTLGRSVETKILRRSTRTRTARQNGNEGADGEQNKSLEEIPEEEDQEEGEELFETSAVWYYCEQRQRQEQHKPPPALPSSPPSPPPPSLSSSVFLRGYKEANEKKLVDQSIKKGYYSIDEGRNYGLIAAAGDGGIVSIFSSASDLLLSYKAHQGWCANAQFVNNRNNVLATAGGMDGTIALWNIASVEVKKQTPTLQTRNTDMHEAGVFSLNVFNENSIFTASKDRSVCSSRITEDGQLKVLRRFDDFHSGVVKCVKARSEDVFATCGNDGIVAIWDTRDSKARPVHHIENAHGGCAVNFVEWNVEGDINQIVTSAFDDSINLLDVRRVDGGKLHRFNAHKHPRVQKHKMLYSPAFTFNGRAIVTAGEGTSALTIYDIENKSKVCSGDIGFDSTTLTCLSGGRVAAANKREISIFLPIVC